MKIYKLLVQFYIGITLFIQGWIKDGVITIVAPEHLQAVCAVLASGIP
jgi:hypothetical protein